MSAPAVTRTRRHSFFRLLAAGTGAALVLTGAVALPAQAAPGDTSRATGQYLAGSLLGLDATLLASLGGEVATSTGSATDTQGPNDLDIGALGLVNLDVGGGIQIPIDLGDIGLVAQYAQARADGSSTGASGLITSTGGIGVIGNDDAPGPLHLSLGGVVDSLTGDLGSAVTNELADLDLTVGVTGATATQASPASASATGDYALADTTLSFTSPTVAGLTAAINGQVANVQTAVNGLDATLDTALTGVLGVLGGVLDVDVSVADTDLSAAVAPLLTGSLTDPAYPGVSLDLATGKVTVDLAEITTLEGLDPNTDLLTDDVINDITASITGLVSSLVQDVQDTLTTATDNLAVTASAGVAVFPLPTASVLTIDSTVGALLDGDTSGISLLGLGLTLPGGVGAILSALLTPLGVVSTAISTLGTAVLAPVTSTLVPAIKPVLNATLTLTANNQSTSGGVFTETALRATVLPLANALQLNVANASVGPNAVAPTITSITPDNGPTTGGTAVTITGTGFTGATGVTFDGAAGTTFTVVSDTQITVTTPAGTAGPADVVVQSPNGDSQPGEFTYVAAGAPTISSLTPTSGPTAGGTVVTITGTGFTDATGVTFDGAAGTAFVVDSDTQITVTTPAGTAGPADVVVQSPDGDSAPGTFTYLTAPTVSSLTPTFGPTAGGTVVTITGTGLSTATGASFDGVAGSSFTVVDDTTATVVTPAHTAGLVDVAVTSPGGTGTLPNAYTFVDAPTLTSLTPTSGPTTGGTTVTLTGSGFTGATAVTFDGTPGALPVVISDTSMTVITPAHAAGPVDVTIVGLAGNATLTDGFTYIAAPVPPAITSLSPTSGPTAGGTAVTITGTGFTGATGVTFDGAPGTAFTVVNDTTITVTTPAGTAGAADVVVESPNGDSAPGTFTYVAAPTATSLTPDSGPASGGTAVTITGTNLSGTTEVVFGGATSTDITVNSDTSITVITPAHAPGPVDVSVVTPGGVADPGTFTFLDVPVISSLTPTSGPTAGGTVVTITGSGFTGATGVTFGGTQGTSFSVDSDTTITVTTPAGAAGAVDVVVESPNGDSDPGEFTYVAPAAPAITSLTPTSGPEAGGTVVTITGTGFTGATGVTFNGTAGTAFSVDSDTQITVTTPAGTPGAADVVVLSPNGDSTPGEFTYLAAPTVSSLTPTSGPTAGGTSVTITGTGFTGATSVTFGGTAAASFSVDSDTQITATTPAHAAGATDVVVTTPGGSSTPGTFTFVDGPAIASLTPTSGPTAGGTVVTITGSGFTGATGVTFDGTPGTAFTVDSDTQITVTTPAGTAGPADVVVESPDGDSTPGTFTYVDPAAPPVISSLTPTSGPIAGGTVVTITGTGFAGATGVTFDGAAGTAFTVDSDTTITVTTPAGTAGPADVVVQSPNGDSTPGTFTYVAAPSVASIDPEFGPVAGGTSVTITGTGFTGATAVTFDGTPAASVVVANDSTITAVTPAHVAGPVDVAVATPGGTSTLDDGFTYVGVPAITGITPSSGPEAGGTTVTITGTGFSGASAVTFGLTALGLVPAASYTVDSDTQITAVTPAYFPLAVDVTVTTPQGTSAPGVFTFVAVAAPVVTGIDPEAGPIAGGTVVTITGTGFTDATGVTFDGAPGTSFTVVDDTTITVTTPPGAAGEADVVVQSPNGDSAPGTFTYVAPPTITSMTPVTGPTTGGTIVMITGRGFLGSAPSGGVQALAAPATGITGVTFDGLGGTNLFVMSDTLLYVSTPGHPVGPVDVLLLSAYGNSQPGVFTYYAAAPLIDDISPDSGSPDGGTVVTITGSGFTGATGVTFGGVPGTSFTVIDDNTIRVTTPPHAPGAVDVVILSPNGDSDPGTFTYVAGLPVTGGDAAGALVPLGVALLALLAGFALVRRSRRAIG